MGLLKKLKDKVELYDDLVTTQLIKSSSRECIRRQVGKGEVCVDFLGMYDNNNITFFYVLSKYPQTISIDFKEGIRREIRSPKSGVRVSFFNVIKPHSIAWDSAQMQGKLRVLKSAGEEQSAKSVDSYNLHDNIVRMNKQDFIEKSLVYLSEADLTRHRALFTSSILMTISGVRGEEFDDSVAAIEAYCEHNGIQMDRVLYDIPDIVSYFSPFRQVKQYKRGVDSIPSQVMTDEILARLNRYDQGILGSGGLRACYFGTDIYSGFPILKNVKQTTESAEIWLCTAETGGGKSYYIKAMLVQLLALGMNGTIMDVEGREYLSLGEFLSLKSKVQVVNMAEGSGKYFDPVAIPKRTGIKDIDDTAYQLSCNFTSAIFRVLLGRAFDTDTWMTPVLNDCVALTYKVAGVTDDPKTWGLSENLTLFDVYETLKSMRDYRSEVEYKKAVEQAIAYVSPYFDKNGLRASVFKERVLISDIVDADLVICSFGMEGKSINEVDPVQLALMQLSAAQISHQRSIFSKARGKFNFKVWEEFQRWGKFPDSDKTIGVAVTGGRKLGDINIIITNQVSELLRDDIFGIFANKTSFMIGAIDDKQTRSDLAERLSIPQMKPELDEIAKASRVDDSDNIDAENSGSMSMYRYAMLLGLDSSKYGIARMLLPRDISKSSLFKTGVTLKE